MVQTPQHNNAKIINQLQKLMASCENGELLNSEIITPFMTALVDICNARGYVFNIYGDHCNLIVTPGDHAEPIFNLLEAYLDESEIH